MQDLKGSFSGIGIQFTLYKDTIRVVKVVKGGPSESVGIQAGDRIINIDGKAYVGDTISNDGTMLRLKGPKGSVARLGVKRAGQPRTLTFNITRGDVPVKTVDAAYMAAPGTGYIRITGFGDTTYAEFIAALTKLQTQGFAKLIIDLRGNPGGYMETAVQLANEFLPKNSLIVYTKGRKSPRKEYRTDGRGAYQNLPLVVLVDETSASASEILLVPYKTTTEVPSSGVDLLARDWCKSPSNFLTDPCSDSRLHAITPLLADAYKNHTDPVTKRITKQTYC